MQRALFATTILVWVASPAFADINSIRIDVGSGGTVKTLSINQDDASLGNQVGGNLAGTTSLPVRGTWKSIAITQGGALNTVYGSLKATGGSSNATVAATYSGGNNTHALAIGATTAPADPSVTIAVTNTGVSANTITDTLNGNALTYNLALAGTGNTVTNAVAASGAVTLTQGGGGYGITGDNNTVSNTVSGVTSFSHSLTIGGDGNTITNVASGGGGKTIVQSVASSNNQLAVNLTGSGTQSASVSADSGSTVDFALTAAANNSSANVTLSNVVGAAAAAAVVRMTQTALADGATANLTVSGGTYTMGTTLTGGSGAYVYQNSPGAYLNASVTAGANGYTVHIVQ